MMAAVPAPPSDLEQASRQQGISSRTATWCGLGFLLFGLLWRAVRYALEFPIWGDEASLAMNFAWHDYAGLMRQLENCQVAPLLFLWGERAAFDLLGPGEFSLRLLPFLAGSAAIVLFWRLSGLILSPIARLFAVGFLVVADDTLSMSATIKPYSLDLLMSTLLTLLAVQWWRSPGQLRWLIGLVVAVPVALLGSYPAVLVAGGISIAMFRLAWQKDERTRRWFIAYNAAVLGSFLLAYLIGVAQLNTPVGAVTSGTVTTRAGMDWYWAHGFPPSSMLGWPGWLFRQTTGQLTAYPIGDKDGGSIVTVLLCLLGAAWWARRRQWHWVALFTLPIALNVFAALLHRYPYGAARLSQHLAPGICIMAGLGMAALLQRSNSPRLPRVACFAVAVAFTASVGLAGLFRDLRYPYRDRNTLWVRQTMAHMRQQVPASAPVVVSRKPARLDSMFAWYWLNEGPRVSWDQQIPISAGTADELWGFHEGPGSDAACSRLGEALSQRNEAWQLVKRISYDFGEPVTKGQSQQCGLFCFRRPSSVQRPDENRLTQAASHATSRARQ